MYAEVSKCTGVCTVALCLTSGFKVTIVAYCRKSPLLHYLYIYLKLWHIEAMLYGYNKNKATSSKSRSLDNYKLLGLCKCLKLKSMSKCAFGSRYRNSQ
jgi:hypothetical protein